MGRSPSCYAFTLFAVILSEAKNLAVHNKDF